MKSKEKTAEKAEGKFVAPIEKKAFQKVERKEHKMLERGKPMKKAGRGR